MDVNSRAYRQIRRKRISAFYSSPGQARSLREGAGASWQGLTLISSSPSAAKGLISGEVTVKTPQASFQHNTSVSVVI